MCSVCKVQMWGFESEHQNQCKRRILPYLPATRPHVLLSLPFKMLTPSTVVFTEKHKIVFEQQSGHSTIQLSCWHIKLWPLGIPSLLKTTLRLLVASLYYTSQTIGLPNLACMFHLCGFSVRLSPSSPAGNLPGTTLSTHCSLLSPKGEYLHLSMFSETPSRFH